MAFDYKKEFKAYYLPPQKPELVEIPSMNFAAVRGSGNPNEEEGAYKEAIGLLYGIAFTIKMSKRGDHRIDGYFDYVVPPLEGFWWMDDQNGPVCAPAGSPEDPTAFTGIDYSRKEDFQWISVIRLPDFVKQTDFDWAAAEAARKKQADFSKVEFWTYEEGLCVQCMHLGPYDDEPATIRRMEAFAVENGCMSDLSDVRRHHEIYLSDARKCAPERLKTVIRHPVKRR